MVSASLYAASITNGKFNKEHKTLINAPKMIKREYAEDFNVRAKSAGKWYEFDEELTKAFYTKRKEAKAQRDEADELASEAGDLLNAAVKAIKKPKKKK